MGLKQKVMKKLLLICFLHFICTLKFFGCTYIPTSFCATSETFSENLIIYGKIIAVSSNGIDFEIIDVLRGSESKSVIRIWDGEDFDCNGNWSMAASGLGKVNDTLVLILPKIADKKNEWEVIGDYRRPDFFGYTPNLKVANGIISGLISGNITASYIEEKTNYENFKNSWTTNQNCSSIILVTENYNLNEKVKIITLQNHKFRVIANNNVKYKIAVFNVFGLKIDSEEFFIREVEIDLSNKSKGIYFISLMGENNNRKTIKILKK